MKLQIRKKKTLNFYPKKMIDKYKSSCNKVNMQRINQKTLFLYDRYTANDSLKRENNWTRIKENSNLLQKKEELILVHYLEN